MSALSQHGAVNTIQAPSLEGITQPELIEFEVKYSSYVDRVNEINSERSASNRIKPASLRQCIKPKLLHSLCILGRITDAESSDQATDDQVKQWFDTRLRADGKDLAQRVNDAVNSIQYKLKPQDPAGAPESYVLNVITALDEHNASSITKERDQCKELIKRLASRLEPPELKQRMFNAMTMWNSEQKSDLNHFTSKASEIAEHVSAVEIARSQLKRRSDNFSKHSSPQENIPEKKRFKTGHDAPRQIREKPPPKPHTNSNKIDKWNKPCLNTKCKEIHRVNDCPITSEAEKKKLIQEYRAKKMASQNSKSLSTFTLPCAEHENNGRFQVQIEESNFTALGDTGADHCVISSGMLSKIRLKAPHVKLDRISPPVKFNLAVTSSPEINCTASQKTRFNIIVFLPKTNIPVRIREVEYYVVDQPMDETLIGRSLLKSLGFDLEDHLERVRAAIDNKSVAEIRELKLSTLSSEYMCYGETRYDPVEPPVELKSGFGIDSKDSIDTALEEIVLRASEQGISPPGAKELQTLLERFRNVFRIKLGPDPPANVDLLKIQLKPNAKPFRSPQRRYHHHHRVFISSTIRELEKQGAVIKNNNSRWASPALSVPKPGSNSLRFTVDLRGPNSKTLPLQPNMPHLDSELQDCTGSTCYANVDLCNGYWQIPLHADSREIMSIQTPIGIYTPLRVLQGGTDSGSHFQAVTRDKFSNQVPNIIQWLDEFLIHSKTEQELLSHIESFLTVCNEVGFKIHPEKSAFFQKEVRFCGRIISKSGIRYDPRNIEAIQSMHKPKTGPDLQQFICALNWMRTSIPDFARSVQPLQDLLEAVYCSAGSRTKRGIRKVDLSITWTGQHDKCFNDLKGQISRSTTLAHPKPDHDFCLFTDASDTHWAAILTQTATENRNFPIEKQIHEPLGFSSGSFKDSMLNWSVPEKEGYAIVESMTRFNYIIGNRMVSIYTDHANLTYIYDPLGHNSKLARHTVSKLMRWALKLSDFRYIIEHLVGLHNVWADMLTRWAAGSQKHTVTAQTAKISELMIAPISPHLYEEFDWSSRSDLIQAQKSSVNNIPSTVSLSDELLKFPNGAIWLPDNAQSIHIRILIDAHSGKAGHRKRDVTFKNIQPHFNWSTLRDDVKSFVASCLHCLCTSFGEMVPRPFGQALHASRPNEMLHFDF